MALRQLRVPGSRVAGNRIAKSRTCALPTCREFSTQRPHGVQLQRGSAKKDLQATRRDDCPLTGAHPSRWTVWGQGFRPNPWFSDESTGCSTWNISGSRTDEPRGPAPTRDGPPALFHVERSSGARPGYQSESRPGISNVRQRPRSRSALSRCLGAEFRTAGASRESRVAGVPQPGNPRRRPAPGTRTHDDGMHLRVRIPT